MKKPSALSLVDEQNILERLEYSINNFPRFLQYFQLHRSIRILLHIYNTLQSTFYCFDLFNNSSGE